MPHEDITVLQGIRWLMNNAGFESAAQFLRKHWDDKEQPYEITATRLACSFAFEAEGYLDTAVALMVADHVNNFKPERFQRILRKLVPWESMFPIARMDDGSDDSAELAALVKKNVRLMSDVENLQTQLLAAKRTQDHSYNKKEMDNLRLAYNSAEKDLSTVKIANTKLVSETVDLKTLVRSYQSKDKTYLGLEERLQQADRKLAALEAQLKSNEKELERIGAYKNEIERYVKECQRMDKEILDLKTQVIPEEITPYAFRIWPNGDTGPFIEAEDVTLDEAKKLVAVFKK